MVHARTVQKFSHNSCSSVCVHGRSRHRLLRSGRRCASGKGDSIVRRHSDDRKSSLRALENGRRESKELSLEEHKTPARIQSVKQRPNWRRMLQLLKGFRHPQTVEAPTILHVEQHIEVPQTSTAETMVQVSPRGYTGG